MTSDKEAAEAYAAIHAMNAHHASSVIKDFLAGAAHARAEMRDLKFCGYSEELGDTKSGCGDKFVWLGAVNRCMDCEVMYCKPCLKKHCEHEIERLKGIAKDHEADWKRIQDCERAAEGLVEALTTVANRTMGGYTSDRLLAQEALAAWEARNGN